MPSSLDPTYSVEPLMAGEERTMAAVDQVRFSVPSGFTA
jgi:hypothetical protein